MRSPAEASIRPLDGVRTCWIKSTIVSRKHLKKKKKSTTFATVPIFARGLSRNLPTQRVTDQYDDLPNSWTFGVYLLRGTLQFRSHQRADVGMAGVLFG